MSSWNNISNSERPSYSLVQDVNASFKWFILTNRSGLDFLLVPTPSTALRRLHLSSGRRSRFYSKVVNFPSFSHESMFCYIHNYAICWLRIRFILATESYGGHYGPSFVTFFDEQNAKIEEGQITGELITVSALMINKWVIFSWIIDGQDWWSAAVGMMLSSKIKPM